MVRGLGFRLKDGKKMERGGLTEKVARDQVLTFRFTNVGKLPPPVLQVRERARLVGPLGLG